MPESEKRWDVDYRGHLMACVDLERDAADLLVDALNARNDITLRFHSKPDEPGRRRPDGGKRPAKEPDFLYVDDASGVRVAIEIKRPLRNRYKLRDALFAQFAKEIEARLRQPVSCLIMCDDESWWSGSPSWKPPRRTGNEKQQREQMCEDIACVLDREAARIGHGVAQAQTETPEPAPSFWVDLTPSMPAAALVVTFGEQRSVAIVGRPGSGEVQSGDGGSSPIGASASEANGIRRAEGESATEQALAEYWGDIETVARQRRDAVRYAALEQIMRKAYRDLVADANAKFQPYLQAGYETILLLDGRIENHLFAYELDRIGWFHQDAVDPRPGVPEMSPLCASDFDHTQHIIVLDVDPYGVRARVMWRAPGARLTMPAPSLLPEGWSLDR